VADTHGDKSDSPATRNVLLSFAQFLPAVLRPPGLHVRIGAATIGIGTAA